MNGLVIEDIRQDEVTIETSKRIGRYGDSCVKDSEQTKTMLEFSKSSF